MSEPRTATADEMEAIRKSAELHLDRPITDPATGEEWWAWDALKLLATIDAKDAEIARLREQAEALATTLHRWEKGNEPYGTCDWGDCDKEAARWRYGGLEHGHLPVCFAHSLEQQVEALATALHGIAEQADAFAEIVSTIRNVYYWANNAAQRADPLAYLQSRLEYLADKAEAALRVYRKPDSPAIRPVHTKYLDAQLDERCITCLERWPCKEASHE